MQGLEIENKRQNKGRLGGMQPFLQPADLQWMYYWQKVVVS